MTYEEPKAALGDANALGWWTDQPDDDKWGSARERAQEQSQVLRKLADVIETVGIPLEPRYMEFVVDVPWGGDNGVKREIARQCAKLISAVGHDFYPGSARTKLNSEHLWGLTLDLGAGFELRYTTPNSTTCDMVPVLDDEGEPVMEDVKVPEYVTESRPVMKQVCIPLFNKDDS